MFQKAAHKIVGRPAQARVAVFIVKKRFSVFLQQHMHVHPAACLPVNRLGQEGSCLALPGRHILDNVLDDHGVVCHLRHIRQLHFNLHLPGTAYLVVMIFYPDPPIFHHHAHAAAQIVAHILGSRYMIASLIGNLIAVVARCAQVAVPLCLLRVDPVSASLWSDLKPGIVKEIKFKFRPDDHPVCNSLFLHVLQRPQAHVLGILVKGLVLPLPNGAHIAAHGQRWNFCEGIHISRFRIRQKYHITLLNRCIPVIGPVKPDSVDENILVKTLQRNGNVTPPPVNIRHFKIDHADPLLLAQLFDFLALHKSSPFRGAGSLPPLPAARRSFRAFIVS